MCDIQPMRTLLLSLCLLGSLAIGCSSDPQDTGSSGTGGKGGSGGESSGGSGGGSAGAGGGEGGSIPAVPEVAFVGRIDKSEPGTVKFAWSGSEIRFRFSGTDASVRLDDNGQFFTVVVDGQVQATPLNTAPGETLYPVASGLPSGDHEVRLFRRTEAMFGPTRFLGVDLGSGTLLPPPIPAPRKIEIIGDSITCGYGNEGPDQFCNFSADTENHYLTYGSIAARNVNADLITVAWSGKGVIYNYGDNKDQPLPSLYDRIVPTEAASDWDFSWQPDVVVINLGTNDFSTDGDPSEAEFVGAYTTFLEHLRVKYPGAFVLAMVPTLLGGSDLTTAESYIQKAVTARQGAGDSKVTAYSMPVQIDGWGCDWHPSLKTHATMGESLTAKLKEVMGW